MTAAMTQTEMIVNQKRLCASKLLEMSAELQGLVLLRHATCCKVVSGQHQSCCPDTVLTKAVTPSFVAQPLS